MIHCVLRGEALRRADGRRLLGVVEGAGYGLAGVDGDVGDGATVVAGRGRQVPAVGGSRRRRAVPGLTGPLSYFGAAASAAEGLVDAPSARP